MSRHRRLLLSLGTFVAVAGLVAPGGVLLMDMGVENTFGYTADVTRVLPVSGSFSAAQREVYDIVHASRDAGLAACEPDAEAPGRVAGRPR